MTDDESKRLEEEVEKRESLESDLLCANAVYHVDGNAAADRRR
jgi:hypothetical protein